MTNSLMIGVAMALAYARMNDNQKWDFVTENEKLVYRLEIIDDTNMIELSVAKDGYERERFIIAEISMYNMSDEALIKIIANTIDIYEKDWMISEES